MITSDPAALRAADKIAARLAEPPADGIPSPSGRGRTWPQALADGAAGLALLHAERACSGRGDPAVVHAWLTAAASGKITGADNAGLFTGAPALAFVMHAAVGETRRYHSALRHLDAATEALTRRRLAAAHARITSGARPAMREFDLVRGLVGLGVVHLSRHPGSEITRNVLDYLVRLAEPFPHLGGFPPWWTDAAPHGQPDPQYPGGHGNLGVSHGVSSVLAILSRAMLLGIRVPGIGEAIGRICTWTDQWRQGDFADPWWPGFITARQARQGVIDAGLRPRPSWCYGVAGTARSQQLAGLALGDRERQRTAENAILAAIQDHRQLDLLHEAGLCHGTAGLLQAACRMAIDASDTCIADELPQLAVRLTVQVQEEGSFPGPWLMDGAAGAALALHTAGTGHVASGWDAFLALS